MGSSVKNRRGVWQVAKRSVQQFNADDMITYAAALSYYMFFSLFPFIIFLLALLGLLNLTSFFDWLLTQSQTVLPGQALGLVKNIVGQVRGQAASGLLSFGAIVALWSASAAVRMAMHALNVAYDTEDRVAWQKFPLSILYSLVLAILVIVAVGLMVLGSQVAQWIGPLVGLGSAFVTLWTWLRIPVAVVLMMLVLALIYYLFPKGHQPFKFIMPGALISVIFWVAASLGFSWYVKNFANYSATYGAIAAVIVIMLYSFISAAIVLLGAEINAEIYRQASERGGGDEKKTG